MLGFTVPLLAFGFVQGMLLPCSSKSCCYHARSNNKHWMKHWGAWSTKIEWFTRISHVLGPSSWVQAVSPCVAYRCDMGWNSAGTVAIMLLMPLPIARPAIWLCKQAETDVRPSSHSTLLCMTCTCMHLLESARFDRQFVPLPPCEQTLKIASLLSKLTL